MTRTKHVFQELRSIIATRHVHGLSRARMIVDGYLASHKSKDHAIESLRRELTPYLKNTTLAQTEFVASLLGYIERKAHKLAA